jgi:transposase-like protein
VPTAYPKEFRRDVIAVARQGEQTIAQVARSFGVSQSCLNRWLRIADREDGVGVAVARSAASDDPEVRDLRKRNRQLEQEVEILRRATAYFARQTFPK